MSALIASSGPSVSSGPQTKQLAGFFGGNEGISQAWMGISAHAARRACLERSICSATGHPATRDPRRRRGPSTSRSASSASSRQRRGALRSAHRQRDRFADLLGNRDRGLHPLSCDPGHTPVAKTGRERLLGARHARARRVAWCLNGRCSNSRQLDADAACVHQEFAFASPPFTCSRSEVAGRPGDR
jgi:hypothetical protein